MKKRILTMMLAVIMLVGMLPAFTLTASAANADTWDGTTVDTSWHNTTDMEFTIDTAAELAGLASIVNDGTDNFSGDTITLGADIDLADKAWTPIGKNATYSFQGTFEGGGHTISNLKIESDAQYVGMFGYINGGTVKNVVLESPEVTTSYASANASVGALVGYQSGSGNIEYSAVRNGSVAAQNSTCASTYSGLGGLVGCHNSSGRVIGCYNYMTAVSTKDNTMTRCGGVAGSVKEMAKSLYTYNTNQKGIPVVGGYASGSGTPAQYSAYLKADGTASSSISWSSYSVALSEEEFANGTAAYYLRIGAYSEFNTVSYPWGQVVEGDTTDPVPVWNGANVYRVSYVNETGTVVKIYLNDLETKTIDGETYRVIRDVYDWVMFSDFVNTNNGNTYPNRDWNAIVEPAGTTLDFSVLGTLGYNNGSWQDVVTIGASSNAPGYYNGIFNGNGCTITGLNYSASGYYALFGYTGTDARISNITLENATVTGTGTSNYAAYVRTNRGTLENCHAVNVTVSAPNGWCGGVAYENYGTLKNCSFSGSVTSGNNAGGIASSAYSGAEIIECWNDGSITGKTTSASYGNYAGGILGQEKDGVTINNCYNTGDITAYFAGGIVGSRYGYGTVKNCHSYGATLTGNSTSPIAKGSGVSNCYYLSDSETDNVGGTTAKTAAEFKNGNVLDLLNSGNTETVWYQYTDYPILEKKEIPHQHNWTYAVSTTNTENDTITATCTADGCNLTNKSGGSVTISAPGELVYSNSSKDAVLTYSDDWALGDVTISYNEVDRVNVTKQDITASITLGEGEGAKTASVTYQVQPRTITADMVTIEPVTYEYNGSEKTITVTVKYDDDTPLTAGTDYTVSGTLSATNLSTGDGYAVTVEGKGNYKTEAPITKYWTITMAKMNVTASGVETNYDANEHSITVSGAPDGATIAYGTVEDTYDLTENPKFKDVGEYTVYFKVVCENYEDFTGSAVVKIKIVDQAAPAAPTEKDKTATTVELNTITIDGFGNVQYAFSPTNTAPTEESAWQTSTEFTGLAKNTTYYFFARYAGDKNHNPSPASEATAITTLNTYTITFVADGGSGEMDPGAVESGSTYTLPTCAFTAPAGKQFKAWEVNGTEYAAGDKITITDDTTVKAVWEYIPHVHSIDGTSPDITWTPIGELADITGPGNYYLTGDITSSSSWSVSSNINLCLNGYELMFTASSGSRYITVNSGATLSICDCTEEQTGLVASAKGSYTIYNKGTVNLYSGTVDYTAANSNIAAVENLSGATFNMYGGKIDSVYHAIRNKGTLNISGGTITSKNDAIQADAGEVNISGTALVTTASTSTWATLNFYGGTLNIKGGTITHGNGGLPIQIPASATGALNISGGSISTSGKKSTIYLASTNVDVTITGGSITNTYGSVSYSSTDGRRYGWAIDVIGVKSLTISGAPTIDSIYLARDKTITVGEGGLSNTTPIAVYCRDCPAAVTGQNNADYSAYFTPKENYAGTYVIYNADDNVVMFSRVAQVTYADGVNGEELFADQSYSTYIGAATPVFVGTLQRTGYTFIGWSPELSETVTGSVTYIAQWQINQYTITFNTDGGSTIDPITQDYGTAVTAPADPTREGYTFLGWMDKDGKDATIPATMPAEDLSFTAKWAANAGQMEKYSAYQVLHYQETLNGTYEEVTADKQFPVYGKVGETVSATAKSYTGYTLNAEKTVSSAVLEEASVDGNNQLVLTTLAFYYDLNDYTITFDTDGGSVIEPITLPYTAAVTAHGNPTKTGHTFAGWDKPIPTTMPAENVTITAQWTVNQYTITFVTNGGTDIAQIKQNYGTKVTAPTTTKAGYDFGGWYEDETLSTTPFVFTEDTTITDRNITLYAKWNPAEGTAYTVNHHFQNIENDEYTVDPETKYGTTEAQTAAEARNVTGFTAGAVTQKPISGDGTTVIDIYYTRNTHTLTFKPENGEADIVDTVKYGATITAPAAPEKTGYTFNSWGDVAATMPDEDVTYTAEWTANTYTVTLVTSNGTIREGDVTEYTYGVGATLPANVTRNGYHFGGWYDNADCEGEPVTGITTTDIGDKTFYAKWILVLSAIPTYNVEIPDTILNGDVASSKETAYEGETVTITIAPNDGYELGTLAVTDSKGKLVELTKVSDTKYSFVMPASNVEVSPVFVVKSLACPKDNTCPIYPFPDAQTTAWYHDGVHFCIENGLMVGYDDGSFQPNTATSRAMIVTILWRLDGSPVANYLMTFEDVADGAWYTEAVRWAQSTGVVEGYSDAAFGPNDVITREQMATILWRYCKYKGIDVSVGENTNILPYGDSLGVSDWAMDAMQWACGSGMIQGIADGGTMNLEPQDSATRAQVATILYRLSTVIAKN